jgi:riboflavin kinase / FMN adenylyltransferase
LLGRPHFMDAIVEHGEEVGRHLGFPTANLSIAADKCLPAPGVYAMWVRVGDAWHPAATNVGYRPTFGGNRLTVEAFLLDFSSNIYGREVRAVFVERLREERAYPSVDELVGQIARDVDQVRSLLSAAAPPVI